MMASKEIQCLGKIEKNAKLPKKTTQGDQFFIRFDSYICNSLAKGVPTEKNKKKQLEMGTFEIARRHYLYAFNNASMFNVTDAIKNIKMKLLGNV